MRHLCILVSLCAIGAASLLSAHADDPPVKAPETTRLSVAVADFSGADTAIGKFISDTVLTDLSQSKQMRMVERGEIQKAQNELKLQDTLLFEPGQVRTLGRMVRADRIIVGTYLVQGSQVMVNARLLDVSTGRVVSGGAANSSGDMQNLFPVVHKLSHLLHKRITGLDYVIDGEGAAPASNRDAALAGGSPNHSAPSSSYRLGQSSTGTAPAAAGQRSQPAQPSGYHVRDTAAVSAGSTRAVQEPAFVPVPEYLPTYDTYPYYFSYPYPYSWYYPYSYSYPTYFSFGLRLGFNSRSYGHSFGSAHFGRGGGGHRR